jgi:menaquinone-specific isochorismate synthase
MDTTTESMAWLARRDGTMVIGHGPFQQVPTPPDHGLAFHVGDFAMTDPLPWKIPARVECGKRSDFSSRYRMPSRVGVHWQPPDAAAFSVAFQEIMAAIHSGFIEKTVPVVTEHGTWAESAGMAIRSAMMDQTPPLYSYGWMDHHRGFAGATPELLFSTNHGRLETMALAGTARSEDQDVFAVDEKEIREHEYVAQSLAAKLLDLGTTNRHARKIIDLGSIVHFLTVIEVELKTAMSPAELLRRLHPTPALGPLPRTEATMHRLLDWRERLGCPETFGAPFGLWDHGRFDAVVAIRGVWWEDNRLRIPAGCGIIEASRLVNEWRELRLKREAVKHFLG